VLTTGLPLLGALILTAVCGLFVLAEFSLITVDRSTVQRRADEGSVAAGGVLNALRTLSTQLSGTQVGITLTTLAVGYLAEPALGRIARNSLTHLGFGRSAAAATADVLAVVVSTGAAAILGELVPKNIAIATPLRSALAIQGWQRSFTRVARPVISLCNGAANIVLHLFGVEPQEELASARSPGELSSLVRRSARVGTLPEATAVMLERTLEFGERNAEEVMTPRTRVRSVDPDDPVSAVVDLTRGTGLSRFPVVSSEREDVVGVIGLRDAVAVPQDERGHVRVAAVMHEAVVVPGSVKLDALLEQLRGGAHHLAVVVDEFGGWDGIVTFEDLVEELVGDVLDEHDRPRSDVVQARDGSWSVAGLLRPDEVAERTGLTLPEHTSYETVAGLLVRELGRVPAAGDTVTVTAEIPPPADADDGEGPTPVQVRLTVVGMDRRRVDRLRLDRVDPGPDGPDGPAGPDGPDGGGTGVGGAGTGLVAVGRPGRAAS
jgi:CBS domain containing-hemolysin-like protein